MSKNLSLFSNDFNFLDPLFNDDLFRMGPRKGEPLRTDIVENENDYELIIDVPGVEKENIGIEVNDGYLTISVEHKESEENSKKNYIRKERRYYSAKRSFYCGNIEESEIKAKLENGELHITVPKEKEKVITKKQIEIL